jgi:hypothetical protein
MFARYLTAIVCVGLGSCASSSNFSTPKQRNYLTKPGITAEQYSKDEQACVDIAKKDFDAARAKTNIYQPGLAGAAASGFVGGLERGRLRREAFKQTEECLVAKGYRSVPMTPEQLVIYENLDSTNKGKAIAVLASGGDISTLQNAQ